MAVGRGDTIAGRDAATLTFDNRPVVDVRRVAGVRSAHDLVERHRPRPDPVREPRRVGHLVHGVDVDGSDLAMIARLEERLLGEVVGIAALDRRGLAGVECAVVVDLQRIVREERRGRAACR
jgi:hypothetical protein